MKRARLLLLALGVEAALIAVPSRIAAQRQPSARYCAGEAGQGRYPRGCAQPAPARRRSDPAPPVARLGLSQRQLIDLLERNVLCEGLDEQTFSCMVTFEMVGRRAGGRWPIVTMRWAIAHRVGLDQAAITQFRIPFTPVVRIIWTDVEYDLRGGQLCGRSGRPLESRVAHVDARGTRSYVPAELMPAWRDWAYMGPHRDEPGLCERYERRPGQPPSVARVYPHGRQEYRLIERQTAASLRVRDIDGRAN